MKSTDKSGGYQAPNIREFIMTTYLFRSPRFATFTRVALSISLALAVPQMIAAAAPPAPGTMHSFLVWL